MSDDLACVAGTAPEHCITCGDEAIQMTVVATAAGSGAACADAVGAIHDGVAVELVEPVAPGDVLLVHAGVALRNLGPAA